MTDSVRTQQVTRSDLSKPITDDRAELVLLKQLEVTLNSTVHEIFIQRSILDNSIASH